MGIYNAYYGSGDHTAGAIQGEYYGGVLPGLGIAFLAPDLVTHSFDITNSGVAASVPFSAPSITATGTVAVGATLLPIGWIDVRSFGAKCDGATDDTTAIKAAVASMTTYSTLRFPQGATCYMSGSAQIQITASYSIVDFNGATLTWSDSSSSENYIFEAITGTNITFRNGNFNGSGWVTTGPGAYSAAIKVDSTSIYATIENNTFTNMILYRVPTLGGANYETIRNNVCISTGGCAFIGSANYGQILGNRVVDPLDAALVLDASNYGTIAHNTVTNSLYIGASAISIETGSTNWLVEDNNIYTQKSETFQASANGSGVVAANGLVIGNSFITGNQTAPGSASPNVAISTNIYQGVTFAHNIISGSPGALPNGTTLGLESSGMTLRDNTIINPSALTAVIIIPAGGEFNLINNDISSVNPGYGVFVFAGDNASAPVLSKGNTYRSASIGLNFFSQAPTNMPLYEENDRFISVTAPVYGTDWDTNFNTYLAYNWPYKIMQHRSLYGATAPASGTWALGDVVWNYNPATGVVYWICTAAGSPGTWVASNGGTSASFSGTVTAGTTTPTTIGSSGVLLNGVPALQSQTSLNNYYSGGAGNLTGTGSQNAANGLAALYSNTTGYNNAANGLAALYSNTTGYANAANGYQALYFNTTGYNNTANGLRALFSNTTGYNNTANGFQALYFNTTGSNNAANGLQALFSNTTGGNNTANGFQAGRYIADGVTPNQTSSSSVYEGYEAFPLASGDTNENVIGNGAVGNGSNTTTLGNTATVGTWLNGTQHITATAPITSAGTIAAYSTNAGGEITGLIEATSVTITFANSGWTNAAFCVANSSVAATQPYVTAQSNTAVTFTFLALTGNLFYHCDGN
jgi:hypothetical protein